MLAVVLASFLVAYTLLGCNDRNLLKKDETSIADATFTKFISAVKAGDSLYIADMFSKAIRNENDDLQKRATNLIDFICGDVAIRECLVDEFVPENVGLVSVYIIESSHRQHWLLVAFAARS